jgi:hypothetical protein
VLTALNPLAEGEISDGQFLGYIALLAICGVIMLVLAAIGLGQSGGERILNGVLGIGFLGYAGYLFFVFDGGSVLIFWYVFILPVLLIFRAIKGAFSRRTT